MSADDPTYQELLAAYKKALMAVSTGQSYAIAGRTLQRADLAQIRSTIQWLQEQIAIEENQGSGGMDAFVTFREQP